MMKASKVKKFTGKRKRIVLICLLAIVIVIAVMLAVVYFFWQNTKDYNPDSMFAAQTDSTQMLEEQGFTGLEDIETAELPENAMMHNGKTYVLNEDIVSVLFLGIDMHSGNQAQTWTGHQADTLIIAALDVKENTMSLISIPRDSITDVKLLDFDRKEVGIQKEPIALAHSYGDGGTLSSVLTMEAASNLLYNVPMHQYLSLNVDGIAPATELVEGVEVTVMEDFTTLYKDMEEGNTVALNGEKARVYVQARRMEGLSGENIDRMKRQMQFLKSYFNKVKQKTKENITFPITLVNQLSDYITTNMNTSEISYIAHIMLDYGIDDQRTYTVPGEMTSDGYIVNDEGLRDIIRTVYYLEQE